MPGVDRLALQAMAAVAALYLASVELVTVFQPGRPRAGVRQQGQALLSGMWALVGVAALVAGLLRDRRELRIGALALLAVTLGKVGLYDLRRSTRCTAWRRSSPSACCCCSARSRGSGCGPRLTLSR